jgi:hypothetical protein
MEKGLKDVTYGVQATARIAFCDRTNRKNALSPIASSWQTFIVHIDAGSKTPCLP